MRTASDQETAAAPEVSQASNSKRYARVDGVYKESIDRRFSSQGLSKRCVLFFVHSGQVGMVASKTTKGTA